MTSQTKKVEKKPFFLFFFTNKGIKYLFTWPISD